MSRHSAPVEDELVVFLGPSLAREEAKALVRCRLLPPARQGDVWKALAYRHRVLVLIDGVADRRERGRVEGEGWCRGAEKGR